MVFDGLLLYGNTICFERSWLAGILCDLNIILIDDFP